MNTLSQWVGGIGKSMQGFFATTQHEHSSNIPFDRQYLAGTNQVIDGCLSWNKKLLLNNHSGIEHSNIVKTM